MRVHTAARSTVLVGTIGPILARCHRVHAIRDWETRRRSDKALPEMTAAVDAAYREGRPGGRDEFRWLGHALWGPDMPGRADVSAGAGGAPTVVASGLSARRRA